MCACSDDLTSALVPLVAALMRAPPAAALSAELAAPPTPAKPASHTNGSVAVQRHSSRHTDGPLDIHTAAHVFELLARYTQVSAQLKLADTCGADRAAITQSVLTRDSRSHCPCPCIQANRVSKYLELDVSGECRCSADPQRSSHTPTWALELRALTPFFCLCAWWTLYLQGYGSK